MTDCNEVLQHLSEYLDEELPPGTCDAVAQHLAECSDCEGAKQRLLRSIELCRQYRSMETPQPLPADVRQELRDAWEKVRAALTSDQRKLR